MVAENILNLRNSVSYLGYEHSKHDVPFIQDCVFYGCS